MKPTGLRVKLTEKDAWKSVEKSAKESRKDMRKKEEIANDEYGKNGSIGLVRECAEGHTLGQGLDLVVQGEDEAYIIVELIIFSLWHPKEYQYIKL